MITLKQFSLNASTTAIHKCPTTIHHYHYLSCSRGTSCTPHHFTPIYIPGYTREKAYRNTFICNTVCACVVKCKWHIAHIYNNSTLPPLIQVVNKFNSDPSLLLPLNQIVCSRCISYLPNHFTPTPRNIQEITYCTTVLLRVVAIS